MCDLLLVDQNDCVIGYNKKLPTHVNEQLHRAFSIFMYDKSKNSLLLQRRASDKYHSGGLWSNSCCSHPRKGEDMHTALVSRLFEELGFNAEGTACPENEQFVFCGKFGYYAPFGNLSEHEIDHVFVYTMNSASNLTFDPNAEEISEICWMKTDELISDMQAYPTKYSAWFCPAFCLAYTYIYRISSSPNLPSPNELCGRLLDSCRTDVFSIDYRFM